MVFKKDASAPTEGGKRLRLILAAVGALVGVLLLLFGDRLFRSSSNSTEPTVTVSEQEELTAYRQDLEARVKALCESVDGVSGVTVAVTLSGGFVDDYATQWNGDDMEYVILGSGSSASALHLSRQFPAVVGIGVVCRGGGNADVRRELTSLLEAAFSVSSNHIYITEAKG